jgi:saccharopine dehydrogenase (NADP+, L-glutamate forming)
VRNYDALLSDGSKESFQAYPNRDSLPFMKQYHFDKEWPVDTFVRGTLRGNGWTEAWADIFNLIDSLEGAPAAQVEEKLTAVSDDLWQQHAYDDGEADRVVLCVELKVTDPDTGKVIWHQAYNMDAYGNEQGSAMARLVSNTVSLAVEAVLAGNVPIGVWAAPRDEELVISWLSFMRQQGEPIELTDFLA